MLTNEPVFDPTNVSDDQGELLQAVVVQLHQVTERLTALENAQTHATASPVTRAPAKVRHHDPHMQRQTGWQQTHR